LCRKFTLLLNRGSNFDSVSRCKFSVKCLSRFLLMCAILKQKFQFIASTKIFRIIFGVIEWNRRRKYLASQLEYDNGALSEMECVKGGDFGLSFVWNKIAFVALTGSINFNNTQTHNPIRFQTVWKCEIFSIKIELVNFTLCRSKKLQAGWHPLRALQVNPRFLTRES
jgi:hypothetical protein